MEELLELLNTMTEDELVAALVIYKNSIEPTEPDAIITL